MSKKVGKKQQQPKPKKQKNNASSLKGSLKEIKASAPASYGSRQIVSAPVMNGGKSFVVKHCEYLDDLLTQTVFDIPADQIYVLNPGLTTDFPWLATVAAGFEQYRWRKLRFLYKSRAASNTTGTVYMATQLDSQDPDFSSKQEMMAYAGAQTSNIWLSTDHNCLLGRGDYMKKYFVRTGPLTSGQDSQLYDAGKFSVTLLSPTGGSFQGELYVEYEVELFNPKMNIASVGANLQQLASSSSSFFNGLGSDGVWMPDASYVTAGGTQVTFQQAGLYKLDQYSTNAPGGLVQIDDLLLGPGIGVYENTEIFDWTNDNAWTNIYVLVSQASAGINWLVDIVGTFSQVLSVVQAPLAAASLMIGSFGVQDEKSLEICRRRYPHLKFKIRTPRRARAILEGKQRKPALSDERKEAAPQRSLSPARAAAREQELTPGYHAGPKLPQPYRAGGDVRIGQT